MRLPTILRFQTSERAPPGARLPMLDINLLRKDLAHVVARLEARKAPQPFLDVPRFQSLEAERKAIQKEQNKQSRRIHRQKHDGNKK